MSANKENVRDLHQVILHHACNIHIIAAISHLSAFTLDRSCAYSAQ